MKILPPCRTRGWGRLAPPALVDPLALLKEFLLLLGALLCLRRKVRGEFPHIEGARRVEPRLGRLERAFKG